MRSEFSAAKALPFLPRELDLAQELHEQAKAALGDDPTDFELRVFNRAGDLIEIGIRKLEAGYKRGVAALWRSSLMSSWLIA